MIELRPLRAADVSVLESRARDDAEGTARLGMSARRWWAMVSGDPGRHGWMVLRGGLEVGYLDAEETGGRLFVAALVFPELRGRGIGRELIDAARAEAPFRRASVVIGCVEPDNVRALRLLAAAGFTRSGLDGDGLVVHRSPADEEWPVPPAHEGDGPWCGG